MQAFIAACVQRAATPDVARDIDACLSLMSEAADRGAKLIALPELCVGLDIKDGKLAPAAWGEHDHPAVPAFSGFAREHGVEVLVGSIGVLAPDGRIFNRSLFFGRDGKLAGRYDKVHLFDIDLGPGAVYKESATIAPGSRATLAPCAAGTLGMSVCYDLRFPQLYRAYAQAGATLLSVPSAFTKPTGDAHWHALLRARAIENLAFVIAPGQCGGFYGHSLIVDPWGRVLADGGDGVGVVTATIDPAEVTAARRKIPSLVNERQFELGRGVV